MDEDPSAVVGASPTFLIKDSINAGGVFNAYASGNGGKHCPWRLLPAECADNRSAKSLEDIVAFGALLYSQERFLRCTAIQIPARLYWRLWRTGYGIDM